MDDPKKFLRYLMPGALFVTEGLCLVWIHSVATSDPQWWFRVSDAVFAGGIGSAIVILLLTAIVGYVLSTIHHNILWRLANELCRENLVRLVNDLVGGRYCRLRVVRFHDEEKMEYYSPDAFKLTSRNAWLIINLIWHTNLKAGSPNLNASGRMESLWDFSHGLGTSICGSVLLLLAFAVAMCPINEASRMVDLGSWLPALIFVGLWLLLKIWAFWVSRTHAYGFCRLVLVELLKTSERREYSINEQLVERKQ